jgi:hypothetical protein
MASTLIPLFCGKEAHEKCRRMSGSELKERKLREIWTKKLNHAPITASAATGKNSMRRFQLPLLGSSRRPPFGVNQDSFNPEGAS